MYVSHQMVRVHHDEWLRYAETRRLVSQAKTERRPDARQSTRWQPRLRVPRPGRSVSHPASHPVSHA
jgi:hypothetical protein